MGHQVSRIPFHVYGEILSCVHAWILAAMVQVDMELGVLSLSLQGTLRRWEERAAFMLEFWLPISRKHRAGHHFLYTSVELSAEAQREGFLATDIQTGTKWQGPLLSRPKRWEEAFSTGNSGLQISLPFSTMIFWWGQQGKLQAASLWLQTA